MAHLVAQHSFQGNSGVPEDRFINVFHFRAPDAYTPANVQTISDAVRDFYVANASVIGVGLTGFMNPNMDAEGHTVKVYDMADPKPRAPQLTQIHAFGGGGYGGGTALPFEVACCLSFAGAPNSGVPAARLRGRIYIGPLNTGAAETSNGGQIPGPDDTFRQVLVQLAKDLSDQVAADGMQWCVFSVRDQVLHTITRAWSDNAWDTQRRRGNDPTSRETLVF